MIAPGTLLQNRYLVESQIGQGGMGAVFVATDQRFGSRVALKETFFADSNLRRAFEREARLLNRLRHAALPRVSDHFNEDEGQFLVMEYIPGEDLSEMLKRQGGPFPARDVLAWADQLLDALDYLHTQEPPVIHRDIKPQNLKLLPRNRSNQIVLLDFGLAKGTPLQTRVTATGSLFGYSFNYAPIEQMQGAGTDPRSDLYSLGATLYHLLTGATPPDALTRATAVLNSDPDPLRPASELHAQVPPEVAAVLNRAMAQSAARRFASANEMREALRLAGERAGDALAAPLAAPKDAPTVVNSEQETRLMGSASAAGGTPTRPNATRAEEMGVADADEGATLLDDAAAPTAAAASAATTNAGASQTQPSSKAGAADSVLTRVAPRSLAAAPKRSGSGLALGVAAGVFALVLVGVGLYALTGGFRGAASEPVEPHTLQQPQAAPTAEPSPAATQQAEAPATEATPEEQRRVTSVTTTAKGSKPRAADAQPQQAPPPQPHVHAPGAPMPEADAAADPAAPRHPTLPGREGAVRPLTREEAQELIRRANERRLRSRQLRQRMRQEQRRQGSEPPPPPLRSP
ncbi:MAG TPA: serine/threonine-protein kinase [Pyrinomonadaceae bacterium]|nr:serine/threonine-protein kinase [Pyrinomonadaceae bacterium]